MFSQVQHGLYTFFFYLSASRAIHKTDGSAFWQIPLDAEYLNNIWSTKLDNVAAYNSVKIWSHQGWYYWSILPTKIPKKAFYAHSDCILKDAVNLPYMQIQLILKQQNSLIFYLRNMAAAVLRILVFVIWKTKMNCLDYQE